MRLPHWIRTVPLKETHAVKKLLRNYGLSTVCEEARCPNQGKCFAKKTATFMILGDRCKRNCSFCAVQYAEPLPPDIKEPQKIASAAKALGLNYVVITSVTRDDLLDGGAAHFFDTIKTVKEQIDDMRVEVLVPDFQGDREAIETVLHAEPDVFNHNMETVKRLYPLVRPLADYNCSLEVLALAKKFNKRMITKSGIMVGFGERFEEVLDVMNDLRAVDCDILTIGQYLRPKKDNIAVTEYVLPKIFAEYKKLALNMGFKSVASSPLTRSSMDAEEISHV